LNFFKRNKFQNSKESLLIQPYAANAADISTIEFVITHSNPATIKMTIELSKIYRWILINFFIEYFAILKAKTILDKSLFKRIIHSAFM
jgi:hypothetical protein